MMTPPAFLLLVALIPPSLPTPRWAGASAPAGSDPIVQRLDRIESLLLKLEQSQVKNCGAGDAAEHVFGTATDSLLHESLLQRLDALSTDTQVSIDDLTEKILRLEERLGHHERSSSQQLERLVSLSVSSLELMAAGRTDGSMELRKAVRTLDNRLGTVSNGLQVEIQRFVYAILAGGDQKSTTPKAELVALLAALRTTKRPALKAAKAGRGGGGGGSGGGGSRGGGDAVDAMDQADWKVSGNHSRDKMALGVDSGCDDRWQKLVVTQASVLANKMANMYDELFRQSRAIAGQVFSTALVVNATKWHMDEGFRTIIKQTPSIAEQFDQGAIASVAMTLVDKMDALERRLSQESERYQTEPDVHWQGAVVEILQRLVEEERNSSRALGEDIAELQHLIDKYGRSIGSLLVKIEGRGNRTAAAAKTSWADDDDEEDPDV